MSNEEEKNTINENDNLYNGILKYETLSPRDKKDLENNLYLYIQKILSNQQGTQELKDEYAPIIMMKILNGGLKNNKSIKNFISISFRNHKIDQYRKENKKRNVDITYDSDFFYTNLIFTKKDLKKESEENLIVSGLTKEEQNVLDNLIEGYTMIPDYSYTFVKDTKEKIKKMYNYTMVLD